MRLIKGGAIHKREIMDYKKESHLRSILKGLTWRIIASSTIVAIAYFTTGDIDTALKIGGIEFLIKLILYYLHERVWQLAQIGTVRKIVEPKKTNT